MEGASKKPNSASAFLTATPSPRKAKQNEGLPRTAGWWRRAASLTYLRGRQQAQKSDQHKVQILSGAVAAALGAHEPGDRAKICIKQFTARCRPGFNGLEKVLTNQGPWQGPSPTTPSQATPPGSRATSSVNLCWSPDGSAPRCLLAPRSQGLKGQEKSARYPGTLSRRCQVFC